MKKLWLIIGCIVVISAFAAGYATMQQTARKEKETLATDVPFVTVIRDRELNGAIGYEWIDASSEEIKIGRFDAVLLAKHDGDNLYLGLEIPTGIRFDYFEIYVAFDANRNGDFFDRGDDILIARLEEGDYLKSEEVDYFYPETYQFALDRDFGGTNNAVAVVSVGTVLLEDNVVYTVEFKKSLTGDVGMDVNLQPGDEVSMVIGVIGEASPKDEQVSKPIRMWLKKIKAGAAFIGKIFYGDFSDEKGKRDGKIDIKIPRTPEEGGTIKIDPGKYKTKDAKLEDFDGDGVLDFVWYAKGKPQVVDLDGDRTIDVVIDNKGKKWSVGLNKENEEKSRFVYHPRSNKITGFQYAVPAGAQIVLTAGKHEVSARATDKGSFEIAPGEKFQLSDCKFDKIELKNGKIHIVFKK